MIRKLQYMKTVSGSHKHTHTHTVFDWEFTLLTSSFIFGQSCTTRMLNMACAMTKWSKILFTISLNLNTNSVKSERCVNILWWKVMHIQVTGQVTYVIKSNFRVCHWDYAYNHGTLNLGHNTNQVVMCVGCMLFLIRVSMSYFEFN